jgi:GNAT superfamily N-acetyltransferase
VNFAIRSARPKDTPAILRLIRGLAEYERLLEHVEVDEARIERTLFAANPRAFCEIAEADGEAVGFALWFYTYSTFLGRHGIWLEDLFVDPELRGQEIGRALLRSLARRCVEEGLGRLEWAVLDWNEPSIRFYRSLGAVPLEEWASYRLAGEALVKLGATGG